MSEMDSFIMGAGRDPAPHVNRKNSQRERDPQSGRQEVYRTNPATGRRETLVRSPVGDYWQDSSRVIRYEDGFVIDLEG